VEQHRLMKGIWGTVYSGCEAMGFHKAHRP